MLELTPLVGSKSGRGAGLSDETNSKVSAWKKVLMLVAMVGLVGVAATQMPKTWSVRESSSAAAMKVKEAVMMREGQQANLVRNDAGDSCGPTAASSTPAYTFVTGRVIGCSGPFTGGLFDGSAETLCDAVNGWRVCTSQNDASAQGLTKAKCESAPGNKFFATQQKGKGAHKCEGSGTNDVFGCGGKDLGLATVDASCSPLMYTGGNLFHAYNGKQWSCAACTGTGLDELLKVSHQLNGAASYDGGVMCCKSGPIQCKSGSYLSASGCVLCPAGHQCSYNAKKICLKGYYQPLGGQSSCKKASCGFYVPAAGATSQVPCRPGTYSKAGASQCLAAPAGFFSPGKVCDPTKCPPGSFQDCEGQTSCPKPPCGHYVLKEGSTVTVPCPVGTYQPDQGKTKCLVTGPGQYAGTGHCKPRTCIPGYYQNAPKQGSCKPADCGKKVASAGANTQAACGVGEYQPQKGQASCLPIPAGYFATANKCAINCCPLGKYRNALFQCVEAQCGYFVPRKCMSGQLKCPAGTFSAKGASACTPAPPGTIPTANQCGTKKCEAGTYQPLAGQTACKVAKCGHTAAGTGLTKQTPCPAGQYQNLPGKTVCLPCNPGSANPSKGKCSCASCLGGTYQPAPGQTTCKESDCGHFVSGTGATKQTACPPGKYQDKKKQTGCVAAPAGTYAVGGKCSPTECPVGTFSGTSGATKCTDAQCGTFVDAPRQTSPTSCLAGQYQPLPGQTSCLKTPTGSFTNARKKCAETLCAPGFYQPREGQTSCLPAQCGHFVPNKGASSQTPCGLGRYQPKTNQQSCLLAALGHFVATTTACKQEKCLAGQYTDCKGQSGCVLAPCGHKVSGAGKSTFTACPAGSFQDEAGKASCKATPVGTYSGAASCKALKCDPGTYQPLVGQSTCLASDCGHFVDGEGRSSQSPCPAGMFQNKKAQVGCFRATLAEVPGPAFCRRIPHYFMGSGKKNWNDAIKDCASKGGRLAVIRNAAENDAAFKVCRGTGSSANCLIGGTDAPTEKVWKWVDGRLFSDGYTNWMANEPNNARGIEDCAHIWQSAGEWNDVPCNEARAFLCEK